MPVATFHTCRTSSWDLRGAGGGRRDGGDEGELGPSSNSSQEDGRVGFRVTVVVGGGLGGCEMIGPVVRVFVSCDCEGPLDLELSVQGK